MDYSTAELVKWLGDGTRMLGWGAILFIDGGKINAVLKQESIRRTKTAEKLPPISGFISNGADRRFALSECSLVSPRLMFDADLASDRAHLQMGIVEASVWSLANENGGWHVRELHVMHPLQDATLSLDIDLTQAGGTIDESKVIKLDLSNSEKFSLSDYKGDDRLLTEFFRQTFSAMTPEQRQFPIGQFGGDAVVMYRPTAFQLRTQARNRSGEDEEGGVAVLVRLVGWPHGLFPGTSYKYLIPNDRDYSAAALFNPRSLNIPAAVNSLSSVIEDVELDTVVGANGRLQCACRKGFVRLQEQVVKRSYALPIGAKVYNITAHLRISNTVIDMRDRVTVEAGKDHVITHLRLLGNTTVQLMDFEDETGELKDMMAELGLDMDKFMEPADGDFEYEFLPYYRPGQDDELTLDEERSLFNEIVPFRPVFRPTTPPANLFQNDGGSAWMLLILLAFFALLAVAVTQLWVGAASPFIGVLKNVIRSKLVENLSVLPTLEAVTSDILRLSFDNVIKGTDLHHLVDTVSFGQVNPAATTFTISPLEKTVHAAAVQPFVTVPASGNVEWSAEAISGIAEDVRLSIDTNGVFTAPAASDMTKSFAQVLLTATSKTNRAIHSSAMITVVTEPLHANPSIVVAPPNTQVSFNAGALGNPLALEWQYQGESVGKGQSVTVTSPADPGTAAFTVEEIQVKDPASDQTCKCVLVTEMGLKVPMVVSAEVDSELTKVELEARVNGRVVAREDIDWKVLHGPGDVVAGTYIPGGDGKDHFALISSTYDSGDFGIFEGYIILALPLAEHRHITTW
ncbi:hypothetical protein [Pseudomonas sp. NPDC090592]|uniref:hypothetical protein n=1 Tax=Pseudomonas sp. NPDC090592 TaxID=3364480 RepID=UPI00383B496E